MSRNPQSKSRGNKSKNQRRERAFNLESLEQRMLLAVGPQLISIQPDADAVLVDGESRDTAPGEFVFRFDSGQAIDPTSLGGIRLSRAGADGLLGTSDDVTVNASRDVGLLGNDVVMRFAETLPDDRYRIDIIGEGTGPVLRNMELCPFDNDPNTDGIQNFSLDFEIDKGTQVAAVVPQPVTRESGVLSQATDQIEVYFDSTDLDETLAGSREFYQLIFTNDTVENTDDTVYLPVDGGVNYDSARGVATLTFENDLHELANGGGTFRLKIGTNESLPNGPGAKITPNRDPSDYVPDDPNDMTVPQPWDLGELTTSQIVTSSIVNVGTINLPQFPGSNDEPGNRDPEFNAHVAGADSDDRITTIEYNFAETYGGGSFVNLISEAQKQRAREALEIYAGQLGIDLIETEMNGVTIATGVGNATNSTLMLLDNSVNWNNELSAVGTAGAPSFFEAVLAGLGGVFGFNSATILPPDFIGGEARLAEPTFEATFPREHQLVHGKHVFRPDNLDVDLYRFTTPSADGRFTAEIFAERAVTPSNLDSVLRLYEQTDAGLVLIAQNDDYYSEDSFLQVALSGDTTYFVGVSSTGNDNYDPSSPGTGANGTSQGAYELRLDYMPEAGAALADASGVAFDGDGDGQPGGAYNFWFRSGANSGSEMPRNEQQQFDIAGATAGSFTITYDGETTTPIPFNIPTANLEAILENLPNVQVGDLTVTGGDLPDNAVTIEFGGSLASRDLPEITIDTTGLTDGVATVSTVVEGRVGTRVIFVDKMDTTPDTEPGVGTLANPYNTIHAALNQDINGLPLTGSQSDPNAARPGDIVRILGNGSSADTSMPYQIGLQSGTNTPLPDGSELEIPRGVTVMVDAGTAFQLRRGGIFVGSTAVAIDNSQSAFQVLGTPESNVIFTSINDTNLDGSGGMRGDWGGIMFAGEFDTAEGRVRYEDEGIFLNHVGHADIRYGGGIVNLNSVPQEIAPIDIRDARPTIVFNNIMSNGIAAISATPDSFEETNFHAPQYQSTLFTSDYARIGPDIQDNTVSDNSINGLFIRLETLAGSALRKMTVSGRWNDSDIAHIVTEVLEVQGTPGGLMEEAGILSARTDGRLAVDPNVIVKLDGARIETGLGAQLIAEGNAGGTITFTSLFDDRYGASGSFSATNNATRDAAAGDWGGIYIGQQSKASLDHTFISFAGGLSAIEGGIRGFNAIEIHQAEARVTHSTLVNNAGGTGGTGEATRAGRGLNNAAAIFVRGAQPIIIGNRILSSGVSEVVAPAQSADELVAAISINTNALNNVHKTDYGRSTGEIQRFPGNEGNQGPLIRDNRLDDNDVNGLVVRGEYLDTEGVWDDTDITYVLYDNVTVGNFHSHGGLRLESSATESLVVKLGGFVSGAGFDATGRSLDIQDRIGGSLHIVGQPGRPVILTALSDETVGTGIRRDGSVQNQTIRPGLATPIAELPVDTFDISFNLSAEIESNPMLVAGLEEAARYWESRITDPIQLAYDVVIADVGSDPYASASAELVTANYDDVILAMQADAAPDEFDLLSRLPMRNQLTVQGPSEPFEVADTIAMNMPTAKALGFNPAPRPSLTKPGRFRDGQINMTLLYSRADTMDEYAAVMIHEIGHTLGFGTGVPEDGQFGGGITLTPMDLFRMAPGAGAADFTNNPRVVDPDREQVFYDGGLFDPVGLNVPGLTRGDIPVSRGVEPHPDDGQPSHWRSAGAVGMNGIVMGIMDPGAGSRVSANDERALGLMGWDFNTFAFGDVPQPGAWQGIQLDEFSNDRNVDIFTEMESAGANQIGPNGIPNRAEFIGSLAEDEFQADENLRLGYRVHGVINTPADVDIYSFEGIAGAQVWMDIDRSASSLDSVVELIDANGSVLARSDNSIDQDQISINTSVQARPLGQQFYQTDHFSTNRGDAGMRLTLPGADGTRGTYFVRVRSASQNIDDTSAGATQGAYELNLRLRAVDEVPGSVIKYADIRYANIGIDAAGVVSHSPLQTEFVELGDTTSFATAMNVGDPSQTDRGEISISGNLEPIPFDVLLNDEVTQGVDFYRFSVSSASPGFSIDVDYAAGTGNPDTFVAVYRVGVSEGPTEDEADDFELYDLAWFGEGSNIPRDLGSQLSEGSFSTDDPFIGPIYPLLSRDATPGISDFEEVFADGTTQDISYSGDYIVAITSEAVRPLDLIDQLLYPGPVSSGRSIDDSEFEANVPVDLSMAPVNWTLDDMTLYVTTGDGLSAFNPFTGQIREVGPSGNIRALLDENNVLQSVESLAMRGDGSLFSLTVGPTDETSGNLLQIDWAQRVNAAGIPEPQNVTNLGDDGIMTMHYVPPANPGDPPMCEESDDGISYQGMTFTDQWIFGVGTRDIAGTSAGLMGSMPPADYTDSVVYRIDGYPAEIDGNQIDIGTATNINGTDTEVHECPEDPMNPPPYPLNGALTDIIEVGQFDTSVGGPGGVIRGLAEDGGVLYGVSDAGGLYTLTPGMLDSRGNTAFIGAIPGGGGFTGLTFGPEGLGLNSTLFATTDTGSLLAFDMMGNPANVFDGGASSINLIDEMGAPFAGTAQGLTFSTLDTNLWAMDDPNPPIQSNDPVLTFTAPYLPPGARQNSGAAFFTGNESTFDQFNSDFNFPGGAHGEFQFSSNHLASATAEDNPFLYFDYVLRTENISDNDACADYNYGESCAETPRPFHRDGFRVYATTVANPVDSDWTLIGTNNSATVFDADGDPERRAGGSEFARPDNVIGGNQTLNGFGVVQELFDNTRLAEGGMDEDPSVVRQAAIPIGEFAGQSNITFRFEFSTEASFANADVWMPAPPDCVDCFAGDAYGNPLRVPERMGDITDNQIIGNGAADYPRFEVSVGNVSFGVATRGRQFNTPIFGNEADRTMPLIPTFVRWVGAQPATTVGTYQLNIRHAYHDDPFDIFDPTYGPFDVLARDEVGSNGFGEKNRFRDQGQLILHSNQISDSAEYGIRVDASPRLPSGAANLVSINSDKLVRGAVVENNVIVGSGLGGIFYGNDDTGNSVSFGRVTNNTVVGDVQAPTGTGIEVGANSSPTLMNNILAYNEMGISLASSSNSTVIFGQHFHGNVNNGPLGERSSETIVNLDPLTGDDGLFRDPANGNFLLSERGDAAVDSAVNSQEDRPTIVDVYSSIGIDYLSPILAPERDALGQLRQDDVSVDSGLGSDVVKDKGALERTDDSGPSAQLLRPLDNAGNDLDDELFQVYLVGEMLSLFEISLVDLDTSGNSLFGVGMDDSTVDADAVVVRRGNQPLTQGVDYIVSYDATSDILRVIPLAGIWVDGVYTVELAGTIADLAGNPLSDVTRNIVIGVNQDPNDIGGGGDSWHNFDDPEDVDADGFVVARDVVLIVNEINERDFSDDTGRLQTTVIAPPFYDVDNDGFVVARDAVIVINRINRESGNIIAPLSAGVSTDISSDLSDDDAAPRVASNVGQTVDVALRSYELDPMDDFGRLSGSNADAEEGVDELFAAWS